jgi:hypothetical protein
MTLVTYASADEVSSIPSVAKVGKHGSVSVTPSSGYKSFNNLDLRKQLPEVKDCFYGDTINVEAGLALLSSLQSNQNIEKDGVPAILQNLYAHKKIFQLYTRTLLWGEDDEDCEKYYFAVITNDDYRLIQIDYVPDDPDSG